jgi:hypothetical protein
MKACIIILFLISTLISCRPTRDLSFERMVPASVTFPDVKGKFLILNNSYLPDSIQHQMRFENIIVDTLIIRQLFDGLFSVLNTSPINGLCNADYLEIRTPDSTGYLNRLAPAAVLEICKDYNVDYLISFEYYNFNQEIEESYETYCKLGNILVWRIYDRDGALIDNYESKETINWISHGFTYVDEENRTLFIFDCIREAFWIAGVKYGKRISPYWENVARSLYEIRTKTDSGKIVITKDKKILKVLSTLENKTKAYKACYNIAVLSESEGEINAALTWIERAIGNKHNIYASRYKKTLLDRQKSVEILNKQTGIRN